MRKDRIIVSGVLLALAVFLGAGALIGGLGHSAAVASLAGRACGT